MPMPSLAIDMDDTIADTHKKLKEFIYRDFGEVIDDEKLLKGDSSLKEILGPEKYGAYRSYLFQPGFFRDIEIFPNAIQVIEKLNKKFEVFLVSSATEFPYSLKDKIDWANENFPFIHWQQICLCGSKSLVQTDYMIDDRSMNFRTFRGKPYLYTAYHNLHETGFERFDNWEEVAEKFL
jgi:5'-nucleotidase